MKTYEQWKREWHSDRRGQRFGQAFCNDFFGSTVASQIFYEEDYWHADKLITCWLIDNCHYPYVPEKIK